MGKHLDALILTQVEGGILVNRLGLTGTQILDHKAQRLFILLHQLRLRRVLSTTDARRKHIVDRSFLGIFLDAHRTCFQRTTIGSTERLVVSTPGATYQIQSSETHHDRFLKIGKEHTHKADAGEVIDIAHLRFILIYRDTELVPGDRLILRSIRQTWCIFPFVNDIVLTHHKVFRTDADMILEILLIFIEGVVLVDIFHIRCRFIGSIIALSTAVAIRRVTLRIVDEFIAVQDRRLHLIPVRTTVIVIIITGWVSKDAVENRLIDLALYLVEVGAAIEFLFLRISESVETHILQGTASTGCGKGISNRTLRRDLTPLRVGKTVAAIHRHSALIEFLSITENILTDFS